MGQINNRNNKKRENNNEKCDPSTIAAIVGVLTALSSAIGFAVKEWGDQKKEIVKNNLEALEHRNKMDAYAIAKALEQQSKDNCVHPRFLGEQNDLYQQAAKYVKEGDTLNDEFDGFINKANKLIKEIDSDIAKAQKLNTSAASALPAHCHQNVVDMEQRLKSYKINWQAIGQQATGPRARVVAFITGVATFVATWLWGTFDDDNCPDYPSVPNGLTMQELLEHLKSN